MTSTGHTIGTLAYMAPERFSGTTDPRADVYSLACVLHECPTGQRPHPGDRVGQQLAGHLSAPPPQPSRICPDIPPALDAVIAYGMAKDPDQRYQTAAELADAARTALTNPPTRQHQARHHKHPPSPRLDTTGNQPPPPHRCTCHRRLCGFALPGTP
jgi:serine/threonine protein kinase